MSKREKINTKGPSCKEVIYIIRINHVIRVISRRLRRLGKMIWKIG